MEEQSTPLPVHRPKVLLVDDEESILNSLRRLLRGQPYDVLLATSGARRWRCWSNSQWTW